jgi:hypothetical protein
MSTLVLPNNVLFREAAAQVEVIHIREPHEIYAQELGRQARSYAVAGTKHAARGTVISAHVVRGFLSGLFKG